MSAGQPIEIKLYGRLASRLCRLLELIGIRRLTKLDPQSELAKALEGYAGKPIDDEPDHDEPAAIEAGLDREPGEA